MPHLSWGEMRGKFNWDLTVTDRVGSELLGKGGGERKVLLLL